MTSKAAVFCIAKSGSQNERITHEARRVFDSAATRPSSLPCEIGMFSSYFKAGCAD